VRTSDLAGSFNLEKAAPSVIACFGSHITSSKLLEMCRRKNLPSEFKIFHTDKTLIIEELNYQML
jgi:hypothetical protein